MCAEYSLPFIAVLIPRAQLGKAHDSIMAGRIHRRSDAARGHRAAIDVVRNDINVTPLVDVMLVLLIIFMLMTLVTGRGHDVELPTAAAFTLEKDKMQPVVSVDVDGNLWVDKTNLGPVTVASLTEMDTRVQSLWKAPPNEAAIGRIYLKADRKVDYSRVYPVLEYMNRVMINPTTGQTMQSVDIAIESGAGSP
jgi:biopolymer transport protein ExbD